MMHFGTQQEVMNDCVGNWNQTRTNSFFCHHIRVYLESPRICITFFNISSFTVHIQRFCNANNEYCCLRKNIYLSEVSTFSYLPFEYFLVHIWRPIWKLSSRNRVTPVSIQGGVQHGITFAASSPISGALSPIPAALSRSLR